MTFRSGDAIMFMPGEIHSSKTWRRGTFEHDVTTDADKEPIVCVKLSGDPFSVCVYRRQIRLATDKEKDMPAATKTKPKAKDLRREAKALGVEGWEDMSLDELIAAVDEAKESEGSTSKKSSKKSTAKKSTSKRAEPVDEDDDDDDDEDDDDDDDDEDEAPRATKSTKKGSKKAAASKSKAKASKSAKSTKASKKSADADGEAEGPNPYAYGTNLYWFADALIKGGTVRALVKKVAKKVEIKPRSRDYDEESLNAELQRRLIIVSQHLRNDFGFEMDKEGRGWDANIRCYKPE